MLVVSGLQLEEATVDAPRLPDEDAQGNSSIHRKCCPVSWYVGQGLPSRQSVFCDFLSLFRFSELSNLILSRSRSPLASAGRRRSPSPRRRSPSPRRRSPSPRRRSPSPRRRSPSPRRRSPSPRRRSQSRSPPPRRSRTPSPR